MNSSFRSRESLDFTDEKNMLREINVSKDVEIGR